MTPDLWASRRLWSLWDIMHTLRSDAFLKAYHQCVAIHQTLTITNGNPVRYLKGDAETLITHIQSLIDELRALGLTAAAAAMTRGMDVLEAAASAAAPDVMMLRNELSQGISRIPDDLAGRVLLAIDPRHYHFYEQATLFGDEVFNNFPSANYDITEAGTCLALDRGTACVMHISRVLEVGLAVLANYLGVGRHNEWASYIGEIENELASRRTSGISSPDEQFYSEVVAILDRMKHAWRNPTMRSDKVYTVEWAEDILLSVKAFMQHLATKLHE